MDERHTVQDRPGPFATARIADGGRKRSHQEGFANMRNHYPLLLWSLLMLLGGTVLTTHPAAQPADEGQGSVPEVQYEDQAGEPPMAGPQGDAVVDQVQLQRFTSLAEAREEIRRAFVLQEYEQVLALSQEVKQRYDLDPRTDFYRVAAELRLAEKRRRESGEERYQRLRDVPPELPERLMREARRSPPLEVEEEAAAEPPTLVPAVEPAESPAPETDEPETATEADEAEPEEIEVAQAPPEQFPTAPPEDIGEIGEPDVPIDEETLEEIAEAPIASVEEITEQEPAEAPEPSPTETMVAMAPTPAPEGAAAAPEAPVAEAPNIPAVTPEQVAWFIIAMTVGALLLLGVRILRTREREEVLESSGDTTGLDLTGAPMLQPDDETHGGGPAEYSRPTAPGVAPTRAPEGGIGVVEEEVPQEPHRAATGEPSEFEASDEELESLDDLFEPEARPPLEEDVFTPGELLEPGERESTEEFAGLDVPFESETEEPTAEDERDLAVGDEDEDELLLYPAEATIMPGEFNVNEELRRLQEERSDEEEGPLAEQDIETPTDFEVDVPQTPIDLDTIGGLVETPPREPDPDALSLDEEPSLLEEAESREQALPEEPTPQLPERSHDQLPEESTPELPEEPSLALPEVPAEEPEQDRIKERPAAPPASPEEDRTETRIEMAPEGQSTEPGDEEVTQTEAEEEDSLQAFHRDETAEVRLDEPVGEETLTSFMDEDREDVGETTRASLEDAESTQQTPPEDRTRGSETTVTEDLFDRELRLGIEDFDRENWAGAVHHLSIAAALRPEDQKVKERLREARRMRKA